MNWASQIKAHAATKQPKPRKPKLVVHSTWAQTRAPNEETGDPGAVIDVHYTVDGNVLTLTDERGQPAGGKASSYVLQHGEAAARIAKLLARDGMARPKASRAVDASWVV